MPLEMPWTAHPILGASLLGFSCTRYQKSPSLSTSLDGFRISFEHVSGKLEHDLLGILCESLVFSFVESADAPCISL